jgi:hypothetical protein
MDLEEQRRATHLLYDLIERSRTGLHLDDPLSGTRTVPKLGLIFRWKSLMITVIEAPQFGPLQSRPPDSVSLVYGVSAYADDAKKSLKDD